MTTGGGFGVRIRETVAEDILAGGDRAPQPQLDGWRICLGGRGACGSAAVEEKIAVGVHTAAEVKIGTREETQVGVRENAELEERNSNSLGSPHQFSFATGCSAGRDSQRIGRLQSTHSLKRTGARSDLGELRQGIAVAVLGVGNRIGAIAQYIDVRNSSARRKNRGPGCQVVNLFCRWGIGGGKERAQIRGELFHARFRTIESSALFVVHSGESLPFRDQEHEAHHHGGHQQEQKECGDERNA